MGFTKKTYKQIASDILVQICGGEFTERQTYVKGKNFYKLANTPITEIRLIEGTLNGGKNTFSKSVDYELIVDSIEWLAKGVHPDLNTSFSVQYVFTRPSGISDVNVGSVVRTLVEAVSREIEYLYLQTEQAYLAGFIDTATGKALDFVVSLLGIKRKPPQPSSGFVTFGRSTEPEVLAITGEVHLFDGSLEYALNKPLAKEITKLQGTFNGVPVTFEKDIDYLLSQNNVRWLPDGKRPTIKTVFNVDYGAYREIVIPIGSTVAPLSLKPDETRLFRVIEASSVAQTADGKWEVEVPVVSTVPGDSGNVLAGTVIVMPQAISGVEYVINKADIINGVQAEQDFELKERAKHALEFAGKATYVSIESAIRSVEGVRSIFIEEMPDNVPGIVKVVIDGGNIDKISQVINDTKAAGVKIEVLRPAIVYVNVSLTLLLRKETQPAIATVEAEKRIRSYISSLGIGEDVLFSRLIESIVSLDGVWDVKGIKLTAQRPDGFITESENENIEITMDERVEPRLVNISFEKRSKA
jgi:uncharacterized phage protein gp47/JayE